MMIVADVEPTWQSLVGPCNKTVGSRSAFAGIGRPVADSWSTSLQKNQKRIRHDPILVDQNDHWSTSSLNLFSQKNQRWSTRAKTGRPVQIQKMGGRTEMVDREGLVWSTNKNAQNQVSGNKTTVVDQFCHYWSTNWNAQKQDSGKPQWSTRSFIGRPAHRKDKDSCIL